MTAQCPVCFGELVLGDEVNEDAAWWCPYCDAPRDPARAEGPMDPAARSDADEAPAPT